MKKYLVRTPMKIATINPESFVISADYFVTENGQLTFYIDNEVREEAAVFAPMEWASVVSQSNDGEG